MIKIFRVDGADPPSLTASLTVKNPFFYASPYRNCCKLFHHQVPPAFYVERLTAGIIAPYIARGHVVTITATAYKR